jgi:hypothetical protein
MARSKRIEEIFEECLERVFSGESIEQSVSQYPEQATELRGLLETAVAARKATIVEPSPEFRERARQQLQAVFRDRTSTPVRILKPAWNFQPKWAFALIAVLLILMGSSGTVLAANKSMPGQPLYVVKQGAEQLKLAMTTSPTAKAELYTGLAERRVNEIVYLANNGEAIRLEQTTRELDSYLIKISELSGGISEQTTLTARNDGVGQGTGGLEKAASTQAASTNSMSVPDTTAPSTISPGTMVPAPVTATDNNESPTYSGLASIPLYSNDVTATNGTMSVLKARVYYQSVEFPALLKATLASVKPEARSALLNAIAVSESDYQMVLQSLK